MNLKQIKLLLLRSEGVINLLVMLEIIIKRKNYLTCLKSGI